MKRLIQVTAGATLALLLCPGPGSAQTTTGTWTFYVNGAATGTIYATEVRPPIQPDGTSSWPAKRGAVPVRFRLRSGSGPVELQSIFSDGEDSTFPGTNDFSFVRFAPSPAITFSEITTLKADYVFTMGNCGGGSLRWSIRVNVGNDGNPSNDASVFVYYGDLPDLTDCVTDDQSGLNMIGLADLRYDTSQVGGTFYDDYPSAQALVGDLHVVLASLVLDSGWFAGDQRVEARNITVNDNTVALPDGSPTCNLPPAGIKVTKTAGPGAGPVASPRSVPPSDDDTMFRVAGCQYAYNLDVDSLSGVGTYRVEAVINGNPVPGPAIFSLR
jgi:hypothetical protein